eukprot:TRINITY_DN65737_c5_g2_i4.p1 TRINITY_DN65737_c5_g2~~TRINITY_DN65737_c5_g2_i4.p1  ORF type:complete len:893 (-),score=494.38 TRINITY_DN65737_c5_g2_i4:214-2850(-)
MFNAQQQQQQQGQQQAQQTPQVNLPVLLKAAMGGDQNARQQAEQQLKQLEAQHYEFYAVSLAQLLNAHQSDEHVAQLAGLLLKNTLVTRNEVLQQQLAQRWMTVRQDHRLKIRQFTMQALASPKKGVRMAAATVVARIATLEFPAGQWNDVVPMLVKLIGTNDDNLREAAFMTLGYVCEELPDELRSQSNTILNAIHQGMNQSQKNTSIKLAATKALLHSLELTKANFDKKDERDVIMKMVFSPMQSPNVQCRVAAYECLVEIANLYYDTLHQYMRDLFMLTSNAISKETEEVALQAIEFWSTICDVEIERTEDIADATERGLKAPDCHKFAQAALPFLTPLILQGLTRQDEDLDSDEWNVAKASGTCLGLLAEATGDLVLKHVLPWVQKNMQSTNWRHREAATLAFGSILDGPSKESLEPLVTQVFPYIVGYLKDQNDNVKDTAAWTIGRICDLLPGTIQQSWLDGLMTQFVHSLEDRPSIASNVCWAIHNLAAAVKVPQGVQTSALSKYFRVLVKALLKTVSRNDDIGQSNLAVSAYEALNMLVQSAAPDVMQYVDELVPELVNRLNASINASQQTTAFSRDAMTEIQGLLCGALQIIVGKISETQVQGHADKLMFLLLRVLESDNDAVHQDAMMAVGAMANALGPLFQKYMQQFEKFLLAGLRNYQAPHMCGITVGVVGDVAHALGPNLAPFCDSIMQQMLHNLHNPAMDRMIKPPTISAISDIAMEIGGGFDRYLVYVMKMLADASTYQLRKDQLEDLEEIDYANDLRQAICEAYSGIIHGLDAGDKTGLLKQHLQSIVGFLARIALDQTCSDMVLYEAVGVVYDIAQNMDPQAVQTLHNQAILQLVTRAESSSVESTKERAVETRDILRNGAQ